MSLSHSLRRSSCSLSPSRALFLSLLPQIVWLNRSFHLTFRGSKLRASLVPRIKLWAFVLHWTFLSIDRRISSEGITGEVVCDATGVTMNRCSLRVSWTLEKSRHVSWLIILRGLSIRYDNSFLSISPRNLNEPFRITCMPPFSILHRILSWSPETKQYFSIQKKILVRYLALRL